MMNRFAEKLGANSLSLRRARPEILQVNVGQALQSDVRALSRERRAKAQGNHDTRQTIDRIINWLTKTDIPIVDLTGRCARDDSRFSLFHHADRCAPATATRNRPLQSHDFA